MTHPPETEPSEDPENAKAEADRVCAELHNQLERARTLMDQSRRLLTACSFSEPRSFRRQG